MSRPKSDRPAYCKHKRTGRAFVTIDGRQRTLPGAYGSAESRAEYDRLVGTWLANGRTLPQDPAAATTGPTVTMVCLAFWRHAQTFYVGIDGQPTGEADNFRQALRPLRRQYGSTPTVEFGPKKLKALRASMLLPQPVIDPKTNKPQLDGEGKPVTRAGWSRTYANRQTDRIKRVFRWAASEELIPSSVVADLETVDSIRVGREGARETEPVAPVDVAHVEATIPRVSAQVGAMIRLQLLAGMRPGEVVIMRGVDLDTSGDVWTYKPAKHKTATKGHARTIYLGPRAQDVIRPFLKPDLSAYLFSPADADQSRREERRKARKTPLSCGNKAGSNRERRPRRKPGERYTVRSYYQAIAKGCDKAFPPAPELGRLRVKGKRGSRLETATEWRQRLGPEKWAAVQAWIAEHRWHPHQLRHTAGTTYRREGDFEAAKIVLGHRTDSMTELYAERDTRKARDIVARIG